LYIAVNHAIVHIVWVVPVVLFFMFRTLLRIINKTDVFISVVK